MKEENWGYLLLKISQNKMLHTDYSASVYSGGQHTLIYVWRVNRAIEIRGVRYRDYIISYTQHFYMSTCMHLPFDIGRLSEKR